MNPQQARARVADTFPQAFHRARFLEFARNLLHRFDESKAAQWNATYIKDAFKPHVARFERLGTYTSPDDEKLDVLIVHLANEAKLERARTAIRNFVADHLKTRAEKDAALVAFVSPTERQWRFSYVKMEYAAIETESGKVGVETRLTPARRFSYIVGEGESCHTAQSRFLALLQDTENPPTLARIEEAFSVEAITKAFFKQYAALFGDIEAALQKLAARDQAIGDEFTKKHVSTVDFAKKLMGQIVFLYFLQKKGWLGVEQGQDWGTGPHDFLRRLAKGEYGAYDNFFNDILEPLFYDTLATDRGHEAWCRNFQCRIPFLNGGLFEPLGDYDWRQTDITLPNRCFTNTERDPKTGDTGMGILDVFDRYNFTVNEAEPLEKEVAIDPEMLGKVFENLIEENRRKGLGSFYTPREIVHYMCQESLINYLDTSVNTPEPTVPRADLETFVHLGDQISHYEAVDARYVGREMPRKIKENARLLDEKLADITVCDPAVGSGAFPVGMMTEMVRARSALTPYFNDVHERMPYHFKRHAIQNCLYGVDIDPGAVEIAKLRLWLSLVVDEEDVKQIKPLPNLFYKIVTGNSLLGVEKNLFNQELFSRLEALKPRYFDEPDKEKKDRYKQQIEATIHELTNGKEAFDFEIYFSEVFHRKGGFDVVIGNPPYVRIQELKKADARIADLLKRTYASASKGNYDLYVVFVEKGLQLLNGGGQFAFILPHKFFNVQYGEPLREVISRGRHLRHVVHFGDQQIFEGATNYVCLLFLAKGGAENCRWVRADDLAAWLQSFRAPATDLPAARLTGAEWNFSTSLADSLLEKLRRSGTRLLDLPADMSRGHSTGDDEVFVVDANSSEVEEEILRVPVFATDFSRYSYTPNSRWRVIFPYRESNGSIALMSETELRREFPRTFRYLASHRKQLDQRKGARYWYGFTAPRNLKLHEKAQVLVPLLAETGSFALVPSNMRGKLCPMASGGFTVSASASPHRITYLLGLLNSRLLFWMLLRTSNLFRGGWITCTKQYFGELPIPTASPEKQKAVEGLVDRILVAKQQDAAADVSELEQEIDQLVYALYGLTPEEIQIVEAAAK